MTGFRRTLLRFAVVAIVISVAACGGEDPPGKLSLNVTFPQDWKNLLDISVLDASAGSAYIGTVRTIVDCGGAQQIWDSPGSSNRLNFGKPDLTGGCDITVQAITGGVVIMEKTQQSVTVADGAVSSLDMQLSQADGFDFAGTLAWPRMYHSAVAIGNDEVLVLGGSLGGTLGTKSIEKVLYSSQGTTTAAFGCSLDNYSNRQKAVYDPVSGRIFVFLGGTGTLDNEYEAIDVANGLCAPHFLYNTRTEFFPAIYGQQIYLVGGYDMNSVWQNDSIVLNAGTFNEDLESAVGTSTTHYLGECIVESDILSCLGGKAVGGNEIDLIETFDLNNLISFPKQTLLNPKSRVAVAGLSDGCLVITGGIQNLLKFRDVEIYNPLTSQISTFQNVLIYPRFNHTATRLPNDRILIVGGGDTDNVAKSAEIFDPITHTSRELPWKMRIPRSGHTATLLSDGRVLIVGGNSGDTSMEIFNPAGQ